MNKSRTKKKIKPGKYSGTFTAKWSGISSITTADSEIFAEEAQEYLKSDSKLTKMIQRNFEELTIEWNDELTAVKNVSVEEWRSGGISDDGMSIKWLEVTCRFDTDLNIKKDWAEIEDALRFGFYGDLELETKKGWIVFRFSDHEDNSFEQS